MTAPGRCRACRRNLEPLLRLDDYGHLRGWTPHGRCISADCTLAYAVQPWSVGSAERRVRLAGEVERLGRGV